MKIPDAKAAVEKEWKKLETLPARKLEKIKSKRGCHKRDTEKNSKVHFATLIDICHLENAELEPNFQKVQMKGCASRRHCERRDPMQYLLNRDHQHRK